MHGFSAPDAERSYAPDLALEPTHIEVRMRFDLDAQAAISSVTTRPRSIRTSPSGSTARLGKRSTGPASRSDRCISTR